MVTGVELTSLAHGAGCGCKLPASALLPIVRDLPRSADERLLVGSDGSDDAAVFKLSDESRLVTAERLHVDGGVHAVAGPAPASG